MSWMSERHLVSAISNAGGFGVIACGAMTPGPARHRDRRDQEAHRQAVRRQSDHHAPAAVRADRRLRQAQVSHVVLAGGLPPGGAIDRIKGSGAKLICFRAGAGAGQEADALGRRRAGDRGDGGRRPYRPGVDQRAGAGDPAARRRTTSRCSSPAGSAAARRSPAYLEMGAVGVQLGTRFVCAHRDASPTPTSRRRSSAPRRATRSPRCRSTRACR